MQVNSYFLTLCLIMNEENYNEEFNDWAKDIKEQYIHIDNAESGAKGYYCLGCRKEMQGVKSKIPNRQSYFRHHAHSVDKNAKECVRSSREYRERLAEQILHRLKELKVPPVYKYPPNKADGIPNLLQEKQIIKTHKVRSQLSFYEDADGEIKYGKNLDIKDRYLLIRPDITFFDEHDSPILFVEFVITHKVKDDKKIKLKRLGIDTVQIIIPKSPEDEIEKSLKSVRKVKWIHNELEANAKYVSTPEGNSEGILSIDEEQRKLFEESYSCRAAQIGNLIRSIRRCLASQRYRGIKQSFESEISRIERSANENRRRLDSLERKNEREVYSEVEFRFIEIEQESERLGVEEENLRTKRQDLEDRYHAKDRELRFKEEELSKHIREHADLGEAGERIKEKFRLEESRENEFFISEGRRIGESKEEMELTPERIEKLKEEVHSDFERERTGIEQSYTRESDNFRKDQEELRGRRKDITRQVEEFGTYAGQKERELEAEFEAIGNETIKRISQEDGGDNPELSKRIEAILELRGFLSSYEEKRRAYKRYRAGLELARRRT